MKRPLLIGLLTVAILVVGGAWLAARESTLLWLAAHLQARAGDALQLEQVSGSLLREVRVARVQWRSEGTTIRAENASLVWAPWWLLTGKLAFRHANAEMLSVVRTGTADPASRGVPDRLHVPLRLRVWDTRIGTLQYTPTGGATQTYHDLVAGLDLGARTWDVKLERLQTRWGRLRTDATLGTEAPHPLKIDFEMTPEGHVASVPPVHVRANAKGTLDLLAITVTATAQTSVAEGRLEVAPFAPQPVRTIDATLRDFDPHHLGDRLPSARLVGGMKAATGPDGVLRGRIAIDNTARGLLDDKRLPLAALAADVRASPERWTFEGIRVDFADAGAVTGQGWVGGDAAEWRFATEALDLAKLDRGIASTHLAGTLQSAGALDAQRVQLDLRDGRVAMRLDATLHPHEVEVTRARLAANGGGAAEASGRFTLDDKRAFKVTAALARFNPSAYGNFAVATLNGKVTAEGALAPTLVVNARGSITSSTLRGLAVTGTGTVVTRGKGNPTIDIAVNGSVGATQVSARGSVVDPKQLEALDLDLVISGRTLSELYTATNLPFPDTPPYRLAGLIGYRGRTWSLQRFKGQVGRSDLSGELAVDLARERPFMRANLTSTRLDIRDLGGFIGAGPQDTATAPGTAKNAAGERVLPQSEYRVRKLNAADADIRFEARSIQNPRLPLYRMSAHLVLDRGRVTLQPLSFKAAGGDIDARITLDARRAPIRTVADVQSRGLALNRLAPGVKAVMESGGRIDGRALLAMKGNSVAEMLGSAEGDLVLAMNGGAMSDLVLRLANLDIAHALPILARGDKPVPVRCAIADFKAAGGMLRPRNLVIDSEHTVIRGEGEINLKSEALGLRLVAEPKDASLLALRGPIRIDGTMAHPSVHPELGGVIARAGAAVALGAIAGPLAIVPFLEAGKKQIVDCEPLILDASRFIRTAPAPALLEAGGRSAPAGASLRAADASARR